MTSARLDPDAITASLAVKRIGRKVIVFNETASTNDIAAAYAGNVDNDGLAVFADSQTAGRGRSGAEWHSPPGKSILCSVLLTAPIPESEMLCLTAAVAVAEAIGSLCDNPATIKWPNDIMIAGRKIAGILVEARRTSAGPAAIIGIGVNCLQSPEDFPEDIRTAATSMAIETSAACDRTSLARRLLTSVDHWLAAALEDPDQVINRWRQLSIQLNHRLTLVYNGALFSGTCVDIDPGRGLVLHLDSGAIRMFDAAHTSVYKGR